MNLGTDDGDNSQMNEWKMSEECRWDPEELRSEKAEERGAERRVDEGEWWKESGGKK